MIDTKNKELFKVMWAADEEIIFDVKTELSLPLTSKIYTHLSDYIDVDLWRDSFTIQYRDWLNSDNESIYDIHNTVNVEMINALSKMNEILINKIVFYWFDVDRTFYGDFQWMVCPLSGKQLIHLDSQYPKKNALISPVYPLIFPAWD